MLNKIKNKVEIELIRYLRNLNSSYSLSSLSPLLFKSIKEFVLRKGKRVRPMLFVIGYLGFAGKEAPGLYASALSLELLHDFMLVHDDIIDKSTLRRGKPTMHRVLGAYLKKYKKIKFSGEDLSIVIGDVMYAMALHTFLSIKESPLRKEMALKRLIEAAFYTGSGEFMELLLGVKEIRKTTKQDIYKIYDLKTAFYTFACPLSMGAILAGANQNQSDLLFQYGTYLGRAFQIKDDIIGMFSRESAIGKSTLTDLQEAKKTVLIWHAYNYATRKDKTAIKMILAKEKIVKSDLLKMRAIMERSGTLDYARKEVDTLIGKAKDALQSSQMRPQYIRSLDAYSKSLLDF